MRGVADLSVRSNALVRLRGRATQNKQNPWEGAGGG